MSQSRDATWSGMTESRLLHHDGFDIASLSVTSASTANTDGSATVKPSITGQAQAQTAQQKARALLDITSSSDSDSFSKLQRFRRSVLEGIGLRDRFRSYAYAQPFSPCLILLIPPPK